MLRMKPIILSGVFILAQCVLFGQISPPGLGKANTADWLAFGIRQELDTIKGKGWQSMSYAGMGRKSNPDNYNPLFKPAILVLNQEFYHQFLDHWQYSFALSYRRQDSYLNDSPYLHDHPYFEQEFRVYSRISYILKSDRIKLVPTFRQEFRKFFTPDFKETTEDLQLRSRIRLQLSVNLNAKKTHRLIASSEQLFAISKKTAPSTWTGLNYRESRFSLYYSLSLETLPVIIDIGYMNNLLGNKMLYSVSYLAFDIVLENPFQMLRTKDSISENPE